MVGDAGRADLKVRFSKGGVGEEESRAQTLSLTS
jgi:hypothetical protein